MAKVDSRELQDLLELLEHPDSRAYLEIPVSQETQEVQELQAQLETLAVLDSKDPKDLRGPQVWSVLQEPLDSRETLAVQELPVILAILEQRVSQDQPGSQGLRDPLAIRDYQEQRVRQDHQGRKD